MADELNHFPAQDAASGGAPPEAAPPSPPPEAQPSTPADSQEQAPGSAHGQPLAPFMDYLKGQMGGQLPAGWTNDEAAVRDMLAAWRGYQQTAPLARYGQEYQQHYQEFQEYLRQRQGQGQQAGQAQARGAQDKAKNWWNPPMAQEEAQQLFSQWYAQGPDGRMARRPDCPPSVEARLVEYNNYLEGWSRRLTTNPREALQDPVKEIVQEQVQRMLADQQQQQAAQAILQANANWMFMPGPDGQPQPGNYSPLGLAYYQLVQEAGRQGIRDSLAQDRYARERLELHQLRQYAQSQQAATQQALQQQQAAQNGAAQQAAGQMRRQPSEQSSDGSATGRQGSLLAMIRTDLAANGYGVG